MHKYVLVLSWHAVCRCLALHVSSDKSAAWQRGQLALIPLLLWRGSADSEADTENPYRGR